MPMLLCTVMTRACENVINAPWPRWLTSMTMDMVGSWMKRNRSSSKSESLRRFEVRI